MPNWVNNDVSISGKKLNLDTLFAFMDEARKAGKGFCEAFRPMPEILRTFTTGFSTIDGVRHDVWREVEDGTFPDGRKKTKAVAIPEEEKAAIVKEHGTCSWYDWAVRNWGVKWDSPMDDDSDTAFDLSRNPRSITFSMTCPWSLPEPIYNLIAVEYGVTVRVNLSGEWEGPRSITYGPVEED